MDTNTGKLITALLYELDDLYQDRADLIDRTNSLGRMGSRGLANQAGLRDQLVAIKHQIKSLKEELRALGVKSIPDYPGFTQDM